MVRTIHPVPATSVNCDNCQQQDLLKTHNIHTFSCHPNKTLPLISPHPGIAIPLYRYFMSVSWLSCDNDLITAGISVDFVVLSIVRSV